MPQRRCQFQKKYLPGSVWIREDVFSYGDACPLTGARGFVMIKVSLTEGGMTVKKNQENSAQADQQELERKIKVKAAYLSYLVMGLAAIVFAVIRVRQGHPVLDVPAVAFLSVFANQLYRFLKTKTKLSLVLWILAAAAAVGCTVGFFMGY